MSCLDLNITLPQKSSMSLVQTAKAALHVSDIVGRDTSLQTHICDKATVAAEKTEPAAMSLDLAEPLRITVGKVCSISGGTIVVLAGKDGLPLRTKNGGYFLLDPATNPKE